MSEQATKTEDFGSIADAGSETTPEVSVETTPVETTSSEEQTPAETTVESKEETPNLVDDFFSESGVSETDEEDYEETVTIVEETKVEPVQEETKKDLVPAQEETKVEETKVVEEVQAEVKEQEPVVEPEQPQVDQDAQLQEMERIRGEWKEGLVQQYQLSEEESQTMLLSPQDILPKLAANIHEQVFNQLTQFINTFTKEQLPQMIQTVSVQTQRQSEGTTQFYDKWGELKGHTDLVNRISVNYMKENPQADMSAFIRDVGSLAWIQSGQPIAGLVGKLSDGTEQIVEEVMVPATPAPVIGLVPAQQGVGAVATTPVAVNEFADIAALIDSDD